MLLKIAKMALWRVPVRKAILKDAIDDSYVFTLPSWNDVMMSRPFRVNHTIQKGTNLIVSASL